MSDIFRNDAVASAPSLFVPIEISAPMVDMSMLEGRFSESFINMIAAAITPEIERLTSTEGLASSGVRIHLVFAPETYMEHTSEAVTYRRLLISYGQGAPRDLWVRWTRLDGEGDAYSLSDNPDAADVKIEIGEDVPQKIREKEYRFLARTSPDKYRAAMGKRNVTEWRELIKRAVKNGELTRVEKTVEISEETAALNDKLAAVLGITDTRVSEPEVALENDDIAALARAALGIADGPEEVAFDEPIEEVAKAAEEEDIFAGLDQTDEAEEELFEEITLEESEEPVEEEPIAEEESEIEEPIEAEPVIEEVAEAAPVLLEEPIALEKPAAAEEPEVCEEVITREELEARIRAEMEAKIRLEYESRARKQAEDEAERLRIAAEELRAENERLRELARLEDEKRKADEERIRAELEVKLRDESRERERLAEAARVALYEREALERERAREAERREAEERERAERERVERERELEAQRQLEEQKAQRPAVEQKYTYTKKTVLLLFRRSVDPNVTARIHEIIKATIDYYGKSEVYIRIKASLPDSTTVRLDFVEIPVEEMELLTNIIKVLGNSGLGIAKAKIQ